MANKITIPEYTGESIDLAAAGVKMLELRVKREAFPGAAHSANWADLRLEK